MNAEKSFSLENLDEFQLEIVRRPIEEIAAFYREHVKRVSCVELPPEALAEAFEELYPADYRQKTPIRYGFSPVSAPDVSVSFTPRSNGLVLRAGGSRTGKTSVFNLRYAKSDGYICELREDEESWRDYKILRLVRVMYDGRNVFWQEGEPYPFERVEQYSNRKVKQRFALNDALDYLTQLGFPVRDADFLKPTGRLYRWQDDRAIAWEKRYQEELAAREASDAGSRPRRRENSKAT